MAAPTFTALLCLAALLFRAPLHGRYWAWQLARRTSPVERGNYLDALCSLGDDARWGTVALLEHADGEVRQFGVLVAQHVHSAWARAELLANLKDPDPYVQHLAAIGLAIHGDASVIPTLEELYRDNHVNAGVSACLALQYLASPAAVEALNRLAAQPADAARRSALVDALAAIGRPECVPALQALGVDYRPYQPPAPTACVGQRALRALTLAARSPVPPVAPTGPPAGAQRAPRGGAGPSRRPGGACGVWARRWGSLRRWGLCFSTGGWCRAWL